jgi:uncharacterized membrane protein YeiH
MERSRHEQSIHLWPWPSAGGSKGKGGGLSNCKQLTSTQAHLWPKAAGQLAFSLIGSNVALGMGYPIVVVIMSGMMNGICGGILRNVLCNQVPVVFRRELYASVSLAVCTLFLSLDALGVDTELNTEISFAGGLTLRLLAIWGEWRLPIFSYQQHWK